MPRPTVPPGYKVTDKAERVVPISQHVQPLEKQVRTPPDPRQFLRSGSGGLRVTALHGGDGEIRGVTTSLLSGHNVASDGRAIPSVGLQNITTRSNQLPAQVRGAKTSRPSVSSTSAAAHAAAFATHPSPPPAPRPVKQALQKRLPGHEQATPSSKQIISETRRTPPTQHVAANYHENSLTKAQTLVRGERSAGLRARQSEHAKVKRLPVESCGETLRVKQRPSATADLARPTSTTRKATPAPTPASSRGHIDLSSPLTAVKGYDVSQDVDTARSDTAQNLLRFVKERLVVSGAAFDIKETGRETAARLPRPTTTNGRVPRLRGKREGMIVKGVTECEEMVRKGGGQKRAEGEGEEEGEEDDREVVVDKRRLSEKYITENDEQEGEASDDTDSDLELLNRQPSTETSAVSAFVIAALEERLSYENRSLQARIDALERTTDRSVNLVVRHATSTNRSLSGHHLGHRNVSGILAEKRSLSGQFVKEGRNETKEAENTEGARINLSRENREPVEKVVAFGVKRKASSELRASTSSIAEYQRTPKLKSDVIDHDAAVGEGLASQKNEASRHSSKRGTSATLRLWQQPVGVNQDAPVATRRANSVAQPPVAGVQLRFIPLRGPLSSSDEHAFGMNSVVQELRSVLPSRKTAEDNEAVVEDIPPKAAGFVRDQCARFLQSGDISTPLRRGARWSTNTEGPQARGASTSAAQSILGWHFNGVRWEAMKEEPKRSVWKRPEISVTSNNDYNKNLSVLRRWNPEENRGIFENSDPAENAQSIDNAQAGKNHSEAINSNTDIPPADTVCNIPRVSSENRENMSDGPEPAKLNLETAAKHQSASVKLQTVAEESPEIMTQKKEMMSRYTEIAPEHLENMPRRPDCESCTPAQVMKQRPMISAAMMGGDGGDTLTLDIKQAIQGTHGSAMAAVAAIARTTPIIVGRVLDDDDEEAPAEEEAPPPPPPPKLVAAPKAASASKPAAGGGASGGDLAVRASDCVRRGAGVKGLSCVEQAAKNRPQSKGCREQEERQKRENLQQIIVKLCGCDSSEDGEESEEEEEEEEEESEPSCDTKPCTVDLKNLNPPAVSIKVEKKKRMQVPCDSDDDMDGAGGGREGGTLREGGGGKGADDDKICDNCTDCSRQTWESACGELKNVKKAIGGLCPDEALNPLYGSKRKRCKRPGEAESDADLSPPKCRTKCGGTVNEGKRGTRTRREGGKSHAECPKPCGPKCPGPPIGPASPRSKSADQNRAETGTSGDCASPNCAQEPPTKPVRDRCCASSSDTCVRGRTEYGCPCETGKCPGLTATTAVACGLAIVALYHM